MPELNASHVQILPLPPIRPLPSIVLFCPQKQHGLRLHSGHPTVLRFDSGRDPALVPQLVFFLNDSNFLFSCSRVLSCQCGKKSSHPHRFRMNGIACSSFWFGPIPRAMGNRIPLLLYLSRRGVAPSVYHPFSACLYLLLVISFAETTGGRRSAPRFIA